MSMRAQVPPPRLWPGTRNLSALSSSAHQVYSSPSRLADLPRLRACRPASFMPPMCRHSNARSRDPGSLHRCVIPRTGPSRLPEPEPERTLGVGRLGQSSLDAARGGVHHGKELPDGLLVVLQ
jgi:hypothetical protein